MATKAKSAQYTIRGVPLEVDRTLRSRAAERRQSLNQVVVDELIACTQSVKKRADFTSWIGHWIADPAFDEAIREQRQIEWEMWR